MSEGCPYTLGATVGSSCVLTTAVSGSGGGISTAIPRAEEEEAVRKVACVGGAKAVAGLPDRRRDVTAIKANFILSCV